MNQRLLAQIKFNDLLNQVPGLDQKFKVSDATVVGSVFGVIIPYLFVIAGLILLLMLVFGGISMMLAANNENDLKKAQGTITNALLGFLMLFISYWVVHIVEAILGITIF